MTVLVCRETDVVDHWRSTTEALRAILPESGGYYVHRPDSSGYSVDLVVGNSTSETTPRYSGGSAPIVPLLDVPTGRPSLYWMAWHEGWRPPQVGSRRKTRQFCSSSVAIYFGLSGFTKTQVLRAEWAGAEMVTVGTKIEIRFQGNGAAHPHWHLAGLERFDHEAGGLAQFDAMEPAHTGLAAFTDVIDAIGPASDRTTDFSEVDPVSSTEIASAWARVHLATSARWAQEEWGGPGNSDATHASSPAHCREIRSWIVSCVRYLQSELQGQVSRRRM